jgi:uncharacterized protein (DUF305 family)
MKKEPILYGVIGLLVGIIITGFAAGYSVNHGYNGMMRMMGVSNNYMNSSSVDKQFIQQMLPHHESAISMAKLAQQKSNRPEVKTLADNIITSQTAEINKMQSWYRQWYGTDVPKQSSANGMASMMNGSWDEDSLNTATDFDKAFLEEMIPHHQMAVMMANMLENATNRQEMKTLAQDIIVAQSKEIDTMRNWQTQWGYATSSQSPNSMMDMMH